ESTGLTDACPPSASPSSSRKSSRSVSAVRSTVGRAVGVAVSVELPALPDSRFRGALDAGLATGRVSTLIKEPTPAGDRPHGGHRAPTRLITHAKRGFMEHIARLTYRSAAVHINDSPVRCARQRSAETLKQCSLSALARSSAGRGQNIRCSHARGPRSHLLAASRHN